MKITILIATYNRGERLKNTLSSFQGLNTSGIDPEFVIIDNGSSDNTRQVVESFTDSLRIVYLFEPASGKSSALNKALQEAPLGELIVFTDDDIIPDINWLAAVAASGREYPDISVFGGRISPKWPAPLPKWLNDLGPDFFGWAYAYHDLGSSPVLYSQAKSPNEPFGPNFWVRKEVLQTGVLFNTKIGPTNSFSTRIMGEDTHFLRQLQSHNYQILYYPDAVVNHIITNEQIKLRYLIERAKTSGMNRVLSSPFKLPGLYKSNRFLWLLLRYVFGAVAIAKRLPGTLHPNKSKRYKAIINLYKRIGYDLCYIRNSKEVYELSISSL